MATFGYTEFSGTSTSWTANNKYVTRAVLGDPASCTSMSFYVSLANATGKARGVIYEGSTTTPGALLGVTEELTGAVVGWNNLVFATPLILPAGTYYIGILTNLSYSTNSPITGTNRANANTYADGPSNPFGTASSDSRQKSVYVTYDWTRPDMTARKVNAYAVLGSDPAALSARKVNAYAVIDESVVAAPARRRPVVALLG